jgi:hypothetical protein
MRQVDKFEKTASSPPYNIYVFHLFVHFPYDISGVRVYLKTSFERYLLTQSVQRDDKLSANKVAAVVERGGRKTMGIFPLALCSLSYDFFYSRAAAAEAALPAGSGESIFKEIKSE